MYITRCYVRAAGPCGSGGFVKKNTLKPRMVRDARRAGIGAFHGGLADGYR